MYNLGEVIPPAPNIDDKFVKDSLQRIQPVKLGTSSTPAWVYLAGAAVLALLIPLHSPRRSNW